jgi:hypothetical protein
MSSMAVGIRLLPGDVETALLGGFVVPGAVLGHGERKRAASRLRARMAAVSLAAEMGGAATLCLVAQHAGSSERNFSRWFPVRGAIYAFPPPEFGVALGKLAANAQSWKDIGDSVRPLLAMLDANPEGRQFMADLAKLHRTHAWMRLSDGYFAAEIQQVIQANLERAGFRALSLLAYFTEGVRGAFDEWSNDPSASVMIVADAIDDLIKNIPRSTFRPASEESR